MLYPVSANDILEVDQLECSECGRIYNIEDGLAECPSDDCPSNTIDDDWENIECLDSPTDFDEYEMNPDDSFEAGDVFDIEYDH